MNIRREPMISILVICDTKTYKPLARITCEGQTLDRFRSPEDAGVVLAYKIII